MSQQNYLNEIIAVAARILTELRRTRRALMMWAIFPAAMLLLFGLIYAGDGSTQRSFDATAPGILIGAALFFSCLSGPVTTIVAERERRTLRRLLLSPLRASAYFLGIVLAYLAIAFGQTLIVYGIAFFFGGRFHGSLMLGATIVLLSVASYVGLGFFFGARIAKRTEDATGPIAAVGVPLLVLGGTFFPTSILPKYLLTVAYADPVFHMNEALRAVSAKAATLADVRVHVIFLFAFAVFTLMLGVNSYKKMLQQEKHA